MLFFVTFCFAIDYIAALQCNRGQNYAVISSNCQRNVSYCSTVTYFDGNKTDNIVRDCDNDGYCSAFSIGNNQCRTEFNGAEMCCCSSDLCNSSPTLPLPTNCWSGVNNNKTAVPCSNGFCSKTVLVSGDTIYQCDATGDSAGACPAFGNKCSPLQGDHMTVCCCSTDLCNSSPPRFLVISSVLILSCLAIAVFFH